VELGARRDNATRQRAKTDQKLGNASACSRDNALRAAEDISFWVRIESGDGVDALVHGEGRARRRRLEPVRRIAGIGDGAEVEALAGEKLLCGFGQDEGDRPFGLAQALVVGLPVFRQAA
jgi:hypothetical protein